MIHPKDPDTVYVAASGHEWTDNPERGVYRTRDGGETWDHVLFVDEESGAIDLAPWITHRADVDTMIEAYDQWLDPENGVVKAMVSF